MVKPDHDPLWFEASSGLPSRLTRVLSALGVHHLLIGPSQPWWNGIMERCVRTCRAEIRLPERGDVLPQVMEATRSFYNAERCHSRGHDQPPATVYQPSPRRVPADFDPQQVPPTAEPIVVTRRVDASGRISLLDTT